MGGGGTDINAGLSPPVSVIRCPGIWISLFHAHCEQWLSPVYSGSNSPGVCTAGTGWEKGTLHGQTGGPSRQNPLPDHRRAGAEGCNNA